MGNSTKRFGLGVKMGSVSSPAGSASGFTFSLTSRSINLRANTLRGDGSTGAGVFEVAVIQISLRKKETVA